MDWNPTLGVDRYVPGESRFHHDRHVAGDSSSISHDWMNGLCEDSKGDICVAICKELDGYDHAVDIFTRCYFDSQGCRKSKRGKEFMELYFGRMRKPLIKLGSKTPGLDLHLLYFIFDDNMANYAVAPNLFPPISKIKHHLVEGFLSRWEKQT